MSTFDELWPKLRGSQEYRAAFAAEQAKQAIGYQVRALLDQHGWSQKELADKAGLTQGVVSRAADPTYGNLTVNTCVRIAAGFDVAFVGRFVPFSDLPKWFDRLYTEPFRVASFNDEDAALQGATGAFDEAAFDEAAFDTRSGDTVPDGGLFEGGKVLPFVPTDRKPAKKSPPRLRKEGGNTDAGRS